MIRRGHVIVCGIYALYEKEDKQEVSTAGFKPTLWCPPPEITRQEAIIDHRTSSIHTSKWAASYGYQCAAVAR